MLTESLIDPLAFRPNPQNLMSKRDASDSASEASKSDSDSGDTRPRTGVYRPPKLVPMPYSETSATSRSKKDKEARRTFVPTALSQLRSGTDPYAETSTGLGAQPALASARARELARMTEFEEENMTRLVMTKKEAKRRKRDEEDIALGGTGANLAAGDGESGALGSRMSLLMYCGVWGARVWGGRREGMDMRSLGRGGGKGMRLIGLERGCETVGWARRAWAGRR